VKLPILFLQGTRDALADLDLLTPICQRLGPAATLHVLDGADHSFRFPKKSGMTESGTIKELARTVRTWADDL
jgi:predicted alpha/beta-hydrolase family hydrolase